MFESTGQESTSSNKDNKDNKDSKVCEVSWDQLLKKISHTVVHTETTLRLELVEAEDEESEGGTVIGWYEKKLVRNSDEVLQSQVDGVAKMAVPLCDPDSEKPAEGCQLQVWLGVWDLVAKRGLDSSKRTFGQHTKDFFDKFNKLFSKVK